eukprot:scaffold31831_cov56-Isochrysis_galbana.AAC.1
MGLIRDGAMCEWGIRDLPDGSVGLCLRGCWRMGGDGVSRLGCIARDRPRRPAPKSSFPRPHLDK